MTQGDLFTGTRRKAEGQDRVAGVDPEDARKVQWQRRAAKAITWLSHRTDEFTSDDVREMFETEQWFGPHHPNAWGAALSAAAARGEIVRVGYRKSSRPAAHGRIVAVWRRA